MRIEDLPTPCLLLEEAKLDHNLERLRRRLHEVGGDGVRLRPHVKTAKCFEVVQRALRVPGGRPSEGTAAAGASAAAAITVSTLAEAEQFLQCGVTDMIYAVGLAPAKLDAVVALRRRGADLAVILDSVAMAEAVVAAGARHGLRLPALIEIDSDGHRSGVRPGDPLLIEIGRALAATPHAELRGVLTHAGESYNCTGEQAIRAMAERERLAVVACAAALAAAGLPCPVVSLGSTPTAFGAASFAGVTEVRAGVYMFCDLMMAGLGVCTVDDIALSVLTSVVGHQHDKGWLLTDAGWMALSRDRSTAGRPFDAGYGLVCDRLGRLLPGLQVVETNQEHGIVARTGGTPDAGARELAALPIGTRLRILPNHACATAAQHGAYQVLGGGDEVLASWPRFGGW
jgi:D-serine deaminase-like pyridoxal phosphate-dependent protein